MRYMAKMNVIECSFLTSAMQRVLLLLSLIFIIFNCSQPQKNKVGGIAISFDDRFIKEWTALRPIFQKYNAKFTFYITQPDSLTQQEVQLLHELRKDGHEIGCHGAMHVRSMNYIWENSLQQYMENEIFKALRTMKKHGFVPKTFAHPGGSQTWYSDRELLMYFGLLRDVSMKHRNIFGFEYTRQVEDISEIYFQRNAPQKVNALLIDTSAKLTIEDIKKGLRRAAKEGSVMMMFGHKPLTKTTHKPDEYGFDVAFLEQILVESAKLNLKTFTMQECASMQ
jgi:peptidoglycan-N-acetylglucosamine deacetylase